MLLKGKNAIVTGCNRGIGKEILKTFAENGANIFACVRKETEEFSERIKTLSEKNGVEIIPLYFDMTDFEAMKKAVMQIHKSRKKIDILVNNAGFCPNHMRSFQMTLLSTIREVFEVNFFAVLQFTQYVLKLMQTSTKSQGGGGVILNLSSVSAMDGSPGQLAYSASKAALIGFTKTLSHELGQFGIRVNALAPGLTDTDLAKSTWGDFIEEVTQRATIHRLGTPKEIANAVLFLVSDLSSFMTGEIIRVDGGQCI